MSATAITKPGMRMPCSGTPRRASTTLPPRWPSPFGYGLSYFDLRYGKIDLQEKGDALHFAVEVNNPSARDARDAVLIYMQSPYTAYDREHQVEKAAVELVGYTKVEQYENDPQVVTAMREATKRILYTVANSNAMNGTSMNTHEEEIRAPWQGWVRYAQIGTGALALLFLALAIISTQRARRRG